MRYSDYIIFADESGDPNPRSIDPHYPVFVLNFCVFRKDEYAASVLPAVTAFKFEHFGHDAVVLHEQDIHRGKAPFDFDENTQKQITFKDKLNKVISRLDFRIVATAIDMHRFSQHTYLDAYGLALRGCLEIDMHRFSQHTYLDAYGLALVVAWNRRTRFWSRGQSESIAHIILEGRGRKEDASLRLAFRRIVDGDNNLGKTMPGIDILVAPKRSNSIGLQIADLTAYSIGRNYLDPDKPNLVWESLAKPKFLGSLAVLP